MMTENQVILKRKPHLQRTNEELIKMAVEYITFMPGVSEILFYYVLLAVVKPFLVSQRIYPNFMLALIGPSGHLKTSLARLFAFWLEQEDLQEVAFADIASQTVLDNHIAELNGLNLIIDDMHIHPDNYRRNRQAELLDYLSRHCDSRIRQTNIIVTGELIPNGTIFSTRDRIFQVQINEMSDEDLRSYKKKLGALSQNFMATLSDEFLKVLRDNCDSVQADIKSFHNTYENPKEIDSRTRLADNMECMNIVEYLYRKYFCNENAQLSMKSRFEKALINQALYAHNQLCNLRQKEKQIDYVEVVYIILSSKKYLRAEANPRNYTPTGDTYLLYNGHFYITRTALQKGLLTYLKRTISMKAVSDALHDAGVLEEDVSCRTKKWNGIRHYVISRRAIELYCQTKESSKIQ